jgi:MinD-like ATPase involved in chromosome partitioning or flagellar assembly
VPSPPPWEGRPPPPPSAPRSRRRATASWLDDGPSPPDLGGYAGAEGNDNGGAGNGGNDNGGTGMPSWSRGRHGEHVGADVLAVGVPEAPDAPSDAPSGGPLPNHARPGAARAGPPARPHDGESGRGRQLVTAALLPMPPETASGGWRKLLYQVTAGKVNPGPSPDEVRHRRLVERIKTPLEDCHRIAVMSLKGGVGKTTTTVGLGSTLASLRGDRVVAIDANPDRGTLGAKVPRTSPHTVRELLEDAPRLRRYMDVRRYLSQADSRLEVLASANDPETSEAFEEADYRAVDNLLQMHYSILLTDCGTGILHDAMHGVLALADTLVIVSSSTADGGSSASATLDWLEAHGYSQHVREAVSVISNFPPNHNAVNVDSLEKHFAARTRRVVQVPYDPHLAAGGRIVLADLRRETLQAYREVAGAVAERFVPPL